jgi:hypothetical protein
MSRVGPENQALTRAYPARVYERYPQSMRLQRHDRHRPTINEKINSSCHRQFKSHMLNSRETVKYLPATQTSRLPFDQSSFRGEGKDYVDAQRGTPYAKTLVQNSRYDTCRIKPFTGWWKVLRNIFGQQQSCGCAPPKLEPSVKSMT